MVVAIIIIALLLAALCAITVLYHRELIRWANFMENHPPSSNVRLGTEAALPGSKDVVAGINTLLDEATQRERAMGKRERHLLNGLAELSHDIRTPLAGVKGYVQLAKNEDDPSERRRCLELAEQRFDTTQEMLDQLFDYMRIATGSDALDVASYDVIRILSSSLAGHYNAFEEKGWAARVELESKIEALVDEVAMRRIFENILGNMLKHGSSSIDIHSDGRTLVLSNDIESETHIDEDRVFDRFYRGDSARSVPGAGLGLASVKQLCDSMGILVGAEASEDRFTIRLEFE